MKQLICVWSTLGLLGQTPRPHEVQQRGRAPPGSPLVLPPHQPGESPSPSGSVCWEPPVHGLLWLPLACSDTYHSHVWSRHCRRARQEPDNWRLVMNRQTRTQPHAACLLCRVEKHRTHTSRMLRGALRGSRSGVKTQQDPGAERRPRRLSAPEPVTVTWVLADGTGGRVWK